MTPQNIAPSGNECSEDPIYEFLQIIAAQVVENDENIDISTLLIEVLSQDCTCSLE